MTCRECGCGDETACLFPDGTTCWWTTPGICSACFTRAWLIVHGDLPMDLEPWPAESDLTEAGRAALGIEPADVLVTP